MFEGTYPCLSSGQVTCAPTAIFTSYNDAFTSMRDVLSNVSNLASATLSLATTFADFSADTSLFITGDSFYNIADWPMTSNINMTESSLAYKDELMYGENYVEMRTKRELEPEAALALCYDNPWGEAPLNFAAGEGMVDAMERLLARGEDVESPATFPFYRGMTPLHTAAVFNKSDSVEFILKHGADINARWKGLTALMISQDFNSSDISISRLLLEKGIDVDASDFDGNTALMYAARLIQPDRFDLIFNKGADLWRVNNLGQTVFLVAVCADNTELVSFLLDRGADINETDNRGWTAMDYAYGETRDFLLRITQRAATQTLAGFEHTTSMTPITTYSAFSDQMPSVRRGSVKTRFPLAQDSGLWPLLNKTLAKGLSATVPNVPGEEVTPLMLASYDDDLNRLDALLAQGADINQSNINGRTALMQCAGRGSLVTVRALLIRGANAAQTDIQGHNALFYAARRGHQPVVELLRQQSAATSGAAGRSNFSGRWIKNIFERTQRLGNYFLRFYGAVVKPFSL